VIVNILQSGRLSTAIGDSVSLCPPPLAKQQLQQAVHGHNLGFIGQWYQDDGCGWLLHGPSHVAQVWWRLGSSDGIEQT